MLIRKIKKIVLYMMSLVLFMSSLIVIPCEKVEASSPKAVNISVGWDHFAVTKDDGSLWMWGANG